MTNVPLTIRTFHWTSSSMMENKCFKTYLTSNTKILIEVIVNKKNMAGFKMSRHLEKPGKQVIKMYGKQLLTARPVFIVSSNASSIFPGFQTKQANKTNHSILTESVPLTQFRK